MDNSRDNVHEDINKKDIEGHIDDNDIEENIADDLNEEDVSDAPHLAGLGDVDHLLDDIVGILVLHHDVERRGRAVAVHRAHLGGILN